MGAYTQYTKNGIVIRHFPDSKTLVLLKTKKSKPDAIELLKKNLDTFLNVESIKSKDEDGSVSIKLSDDANVANVLKGIGASGGEEIESPESIAKKPAEEEAKQAEKDAAAQQGPQQPPQMGAGAPPEQEMGGPMPLAAGRRPTVFELLYESAFGGKTFLGKNKKRTAKLPGESRKPSHRTGKYWKHLEKVIGKNRSKFTEKDVLDIRKRYSRKPTSEDRNKTLRALDRAFDYFYEVLGREKGASAAEKYAEDYYAVDNLTPKDYSLEKSRPEPIGPDEPTPTPEISVDPELNGPEFSEYADIVSSKPDDFDESDESEDDDVSYDDIDIEEPTY